ncbi:hypothetical protein MKW98_013779 [Papaver atlanticum]|uniref:E2F/DP family winged-helix DNA-binding domain-containing protein n=1 Tax=Papaver atlanticum TaxID=357466 RepID=A0AAD4TES8_9MAGN|nr:hypothetical protein MKW98_013779 [Papaver atlanticum]
MVAEDFVNLVSKCAKKLKAKVELHIMKLWMSLWLNFQQQHLTRRRVYDSLNVLIAADIISKDKNKEIQWRGMLHAAGPNAVEQLKSQYLGLRNKIANKADYLQELEDQFVGLQNLAQRNEQLCCSGRKAATSGGV